MINYFKNTSRFPSVRGQGGDPVSEVVRSRLRWLTAGLLVVVLGGCETLNPITLGVGLASYAATGKGLADHAIGTLTQRDCNILNGLLSPDRKICEPIGSAAAAGGFKGLFATRHATEPRLRLSVTRVIPTPALEDMSFAETSAKPVLRLSDSISPVSNASSDRVASHEPGTTAASIPL